jgi:MFS family permease
VFGASFQDVQWVVLAYLLATTTLVVSAGRLGDIIGRRRLMLSGMLVFTVASALCATAPHLWLLVAMRALQGAGAAVMMALSTAMVADLVPSERTGSAIGFLGTMSAVGTALGPSLGGVLISVSGWSAAFVVLALVGAGAFVMSWILLPVRDRAAKRVGIRFDSLGTVLLALTLGAYSLAMTAGSGFGTRNVALLFVTAVGLTVFGYVQATVRSPLIRLEYLRDGQLQGALLSTSIVAAIVMTTLVVGPFYLAGALALPAALVGLVMSVGPAVAALAGAPAGRLVDRWGTRQAMAAGLAAVTGGCAALALLPLAAGVGGYICAIALLTMGYALFQAANSTAVMNGLAAERRGVISGLLSLARNIGLITAASAMGAVFAAVSAGSGNTAGVAHGTAAAFAVATGLAATALALVLFSRGRRLSPAHD